MALPDTFKLEAGTARSSGISSQAIAAGANYLGSAIDQSANLDIAANVEIVWSCGTGPTADKVLECYFLYAQDDTNFEEGDASTDPKTGFVGAVRAYNDTNTHRAVLRGILLDPYDFKPLIKSELDQSATVTVNIETFNRALVD